MTFQNFSNEHFFFFNKKEIKKKKKKKNHKLSPKADYASFLEVTYIIYIFLSEVKKPSLK